MPVTSSMLVTSPLFEGARHGFSTRQGGVSVGRFASLNVSAKGGDDPAHLEENRRRLADAGRFDLSALFTARQVHGARVAVIESGTIAERVADAEADALVAVAPGVVVGVSTADCVPILFSDGAGRVGAAHAGWRGTVLGVAGAAVEALVSLGAERERIRAALGPSICARCFEVGEEVAAEFHRVSPPSVIRGGGRPHVDLRLANRLQLERAGLREIDAAPPCTGCEPERFFSYRRDGAGGQHLAFIASD